MRDAWVWLGSGWNWAFVLVCAVLLAGAGLMLVAGVRGWLDDEPGWHGEGRDRYYVIPDDELVVVDEFEPELPDWTDAQLAALHEDLPAPVLANVAPHRGGELHYMDTWLGQEGDGTDATFLRVRRNQERALARFERDQAAWWAGEMAAMGVTMPWPGLVAA